MFEPRSEDSLSLINLMKSKGFSFIGTNKSCVNAFFVVDEEACTRCALCVDRCPTGVISLGKFAGSLADQAVQNGVYTAPWDEDSGERNDRHGYIYGRL